MLKLLSNTIFRLTASKILISTSPSIHFNLAYEQHLFQTADLNCPTLLIYRNSPTIVIGRHQNPWKQCHNELMRDNGVALARRKTGGGAVYQDLGNTCFSFLTPYQHDHQYDYKTVNNQILISALARLAVPVEVAGRNDLHCQGRKMSGSAYRLNLGGNQGRGKKALHHGTILFSVDLQALQKYLNPNKKKLESKGISSVISRVMNITEAYPGINHDTFVTQLQTCFVEHYGGQNSRQVVSEETLLKQNSTVNNNFERLKSWDWLYGQCPEFKYSIDRKFDWGMTQVTLNVIDGVIKEGKVYSDCLFPDFITILNEEIISGITYDREGVANLQLKIIKRIQPVQQIMARQFCEWIRKQL